MILLACPAGLALYKGLIYAAFGSHCDRPPYWPWIFAFEAKTLKISSFWTTPSFICKISLLSHLVFVSMALRELDTVNISQALLPTGWLMMVIS